MTDFTAIGDIFSHLHNNEPAHARRLHRRFAAGALRVQPVAVKPNHAFTSYFTAASEGGPTHPKASGSGEVTKAGATGLEPATSAVTGQRSNLLSYAPAMLGTPGATFRAPSVCQGAAVALEPKKTGQPASPSARLA